MTFAPADFVVLGIFMAGVLALGFSARLRENTTLQLIAAGRSLTLPLFVATLVTTWYGGILGMGEAFDSYGLATWVILGLPYYVFAIAFAVWMARRVRGAEQISLPERLDRCYGRSAAVIGALLVLLIGVPAAHIFMLGTLINLTTGLPFIPSALIGAIAGTLFLYRGGLLADARSNLLAFAMMYLSFIVILVAAIAKYGPPGEIIANLPLDHRSWDAGKGIWFVLSWFIIGSWTFVDPGFHQRVVSAATEASAQRGVLISAGFWVLFDLLTVSTALYAYAAMGSGHGAMLFPLFGSDLLPPGMRGLFFAGMFGVILSAMVGYTLVSGATIGRDLIGRLRPGLPEATQTTLTRAGIGLATLIGFLLAIWIQSVVDIWFIVGSIVLPGLLIPTVAAYATKRTPSGGVAVACLVTGFTAALCWYLLGEANLLAAKWDPLMPIYPGLAGAFAALTAGTLLQRARRTR